jgi:hypothetical protein
MVAETVGVGPRVCDVFGRCRTLQPRSFRVRAAYNLRLLDLGYREDFLGVVSSAGTLGCVAGTLPAASLARRIGLWRTLLSAIAASARIAALRALAKGRAALAGLAIASGLAFAGWAVAMAPAVAAAVEEKRPAAFSFFYASMFATGIGAGWVGGSCRFGRMANSRRC